MARLYSDVVKKVREAVNRGTTVDFAIADAIEHAGRFFEQNHSFLYMERIERFFLDPNATHPHVMEAPADLKELNFLQSVDVAPDGGEIYTPLRRFFSEDQRFLATGRPRGYYFAGQNRIFFDAKPTEREYFRLGGFFYTSWPLSIDDPSTQGFQSWLFDNGLRFVVAQAVMYICPIIRNDELMARWAPIANVALQNLIAADAKAQYSDTPMAVNDPSLRSSIYERRFRT